MNKLAEAIETATAVILVRPGGAHKMLTETRRRELVAILKHHWELNHQQRDAANERTQEKK